MPDNFAMNGKYAVYNPPRRIYVENAEEMREAFKNMQARGEKFFIVDFHQTEYIDSAGLGVLVTVYKRALNAGGSIKLVGLRGDVKNVFEVTRLNKVFEIYESVRDVE